MSAKKKLSMSAKKKLSMSAKKKLSRSKNLRNTHLIFIFFFKIKKHKKRKQKKLNHDNCSLTRCTLFFICTPNFLC